MITDFCVELRQSIMERKGLHLLGRSYHWPHVVYISTKYVLSSLWPSIYTLTRKKEGAGSGEGVVD